VVDLIQVIQDGELNYKQNKMIKIINHLLANLFIICLISCGKTISNSEQVEVKPIQIRDSLLAFPGAEGFGRLATGVRGGKVLFVDNLNDSGPGSLRFACEQSGARYVLFRVSGNISLKSPLTIRQNDITIAGQSAPGDGICIKDYPVTIDADNVIIRFIRFRLGDEAKQEGDAIGARFRKNIIIDHCSFSWSTDETVSIYNNENTTLQWCIISESLRNSVHTKGAHGYGGIWGGKGASFHHNLLAHNDSRNPRLGEYAGSAFALTDLVDLRNNVIYNWKGNSCYGGEGMNVNIVNCYYKPGPATSNASKERIVAIDKNKNQGTEVFDIWGKYFVNGNVVEGSQRTTNDNWTYGVANQFHSSYGTIPNSQILAIRQEKEHTINNNVLTQSPTEAYTKVLLYAGASLVRDPVDSRIIEEVKLGKFTFNGSKGSTKGIIDSQNDVGGFPQLNTLDYPKNSSGDGIPDEWKKRKMLDTSKNVAVNKDLSNVYDNLEVYLNELVNTIVVNQK
jgi:hypothetical protein